MTDVPCAGCHLCCHAYVILGDHEYAAYDHELKLVDGRAWLVLKRKPNGDCCYLADGGCAIHGRAPEVCKRFDCRTARTAPPDILARGRELRGGQGHENDQT